MGFFSGISTWIKRTIEAERFYSLYRKSPEQLQAIRADLRATWEDMERQEVANFYRAVGGALTTWALMEERLILIASLLMMTRVKKTELIFYSIINFHVWLAIITELFPLEPNLSHFQKRWNKLAERLRGEKDNRDRLAHTPMVPRTVADNLEGRAVLQTPRLDMRTKSQTSPPLDINDIIKFRGRVDAIANDLFKLLDEMDDHLKMIALASSQQTPSEPLPDQAQ